ncbi:MAG: phosphatase [Thaumarchaeota archaeon]|jgi:3-deoxy-D-manno-octulosonate 8-phosphate phosphatase (KDO 8-P phosphatase)|nr:MAG: phosphatase [Nitrososphaerota archaeon]
MKPEMFVLDVDGVLTTGQFLYSKNGKEFKVFGPDDNDGLSLLKPFLKIHFVTQDKKGFAISKKRIVTDMKYPLNLVKTLDRVEWMKKDTSLKKIIYMGDSIFDHLIFSKVGYSIAPANADPSAKKNADFVTKRNSGERAVAEACIHILKKFFNINDVTTLKKINL